jgi:hypothetical protein
MVDAFVTLAAHAGLRLGALAELLRHLVEGLMRHKDAVEHVPDAFLATITELVSAKATNPYPAIVEHVNAVQQVQHEFLSAAVKEGEQWAKEERRARPVQLAVYFVGKQPLLMLDRVKDNPDRSD